MWPFQHIAIRCVFVQSLKFESIAKQYLHLSTYTCISFCFTWPNEYDSSPRFQRYISKRAKARVAEGPDPFGTHEVSR